LDPPLFRSVMTYMARILRKSMYMNLSMETEVDNIKKTIKKSGLEKLRHIRSLVIKLQDITDDKKRFSEEIEKYEKEVSQSVIQKEKIAEKLKKIRLSNEYMNFEKLKNERDQIVIDIKKSEDQIIQIFGQINSALRKYARIAIDEDTVKKYLDNPVTALKEDKGLKVIAMLTGLKKNIINGTIEMKDKKKEKTLMSIEKFSEDFIVKNQENNLELAGQKKIKDEKIHKNSIMNDYNEQEYLLNHINGKIEETKKNKKISMNNLGKVDLKGLKKKIIDRFESDLNIKLEIS